MKVDYSNLVKELKSIGISISNYPSDSFTNLSIKEYNDLNVLQLNIMDVFHGETPVHLISELIEKMIDVIETNIRDTDICAVKILTGYGSGDHETSKSKNEIINYLQKENYPSWLSFVKYGYKIHSSNFNENYFKEILGTIDSNRGFIYLIARKYQTIVNNHVSYSYSGINQVEVIDIAGSVNGEVLIPETVKNNNLDYEVSGFSENALPENIQLEILTIPNSLLNVDRKIFEKSESLKMVMNYDKSSLIYVSSKLDNFIIPSTIKMIDSKCFYNCNKIKYLIIPDHVNVIGDLAFSSCTNLREIILPNSVKYIGSKILKDCHSLEKISVPLYNDYNDNFNEFSLYHYFYEHDQKKFPNLKEIYITKARNIVKYCFKNMNYVKKIELSDEVQTIGDYAFTDCTSLEQLNIPKSMKKIGYRAFNGCNNIQFELFDENQKYIDDWLIDVITKNIEFLKFKDSIKGIGDGALAGLYKIVSIKLPSVLNRIGDHFLDGCKSLKSITIPDNIKVIGNRAFNECTSLESIKISDSVIEIGKYAFHRCISLSEVTIPNSVNYIGIGIFSECDNLRMLEIPFIGETRQSSGENALISHVFPDTHLLSKNIKSSIYLKDFKEKSIFYCPPANLYEIIITDALKIEEKCFSGLKSVKRITLPDSIKEIGSNAFRNCKKLNSINIPTNISIINEGTFAGTGIKSIDIPDNIRIIENGAFAACSNLEEIYLPPNIEKIGDYVFRGCRELNYIDVDVDNKYFKFENGILIDLMRMEIVLSSKNVESIVIPEGIKSIKSSAFFGAESLKMISFPNSLTTIGTNAFSGCSIVHLNIPDSVNEIGKGAFSDCKSMLTIILPALLKITSEDLFGGCYNLIIFSKDIKRQSNWSSHWNLVFINHYGDDDGFANVYWADDWILYKGLPIPKSIDNMNKIIAEPMRNRFFLKDKLEVFFEQYKEIIKEYQDCIIEI